MSWSNELRRIADAADIERLRSYWTAYRGRMFDTLAAQGPFDRFTGADLYACALLSAEIDPRAGVLLLDDETQPFSSLLRGIPTDVSIRTGRAAEVLADGSPASLLYDRLRGLETIGPTRASKLLAVKRPGLVPIRDSFVEQALGATSSMRWWKPMLEAWSEPALGDAVDRLRERAGDAVPSHVTDLRLLDVATWLTVEARDKRAVGSPGTPAG